MKLVSLWLQRDKLGSWINHLARDNLMMVSGTVNSHFKKVFILKKKKKKKKKKLTGLGRLTNLQLNW